MTHGDILMRELAERGVTSLRDLVEAYAPRGYTYNGFATAATRLRKRRLISGPHGHNGPIVKTDTCPCCGRLL